MNGSDISQIVGRRSFAASDAPGALSVCLVTALTVADFIDFDLVTETHTKTGAQLGVLTLAAILRKDGFQPHVVNLDDLFFAFLKQEKLQSQQCGTVEGFKNPERSASQDREHYFFPFVVDCLK